jgi:hypothetical protein
LIRQLLAAALLVVAASVLSGCTMIAHAIWPCPEQPPSSRLTRDTPDEAVDFLTDAFENRRVGDIYVSLHPQFVRENGDFSQADFQLAYERWEEDFIADGRNMAEAERTFRPLSGAEVVVELTNASTGAFLPIVLVDRPKIRVVTTNPFIAPIEGPVDMKALVRLADGRLALPADFALTSIENVRPATVAGLKSEDVVRVEFFHDWLVRSVDVARAKNVRFMDKIKEYVAK